MRFYSYSFGCRVNEAEKEALDKKLIEKGFVFDEKNPALFIINSCAVTQKAEREARNLIYHLKKQNPKIKIIITGCSATYWLKNRLYQDLPVEMIVDNHQKDFLADLIEKRINFKPKKKSVKQKNDSTSKFLSSGRMLIKIQDGCHRFCSFCIVPYLRGLPKSKTIKEIVNLIKENEKKISEVILTAINTQAFGFDTGEKFTHLIETILNETKISRLSFGSLHPWSINEDFFNFYRQNNFNDRLVHFFHIPIQSGNDKILNLMKRGYQKKEIEEKIFKIHQLNPFALLATDVIVGFLGETDDDFEETYQFLEKSPFFKFHVFRFSKRKNTAAYFMSKNIEEPDHKTKKIRSHILRQLSEKKFYQFQVKNVGRSSLALVIDKKIKNFHQVLFDNQLPVWVETNKKLTVGKIIPVKILQLKKNQLFGKII